MEVVGSLGVAILLGAFFTNLMGWLASSSKLYQGLNALGAAIAGYASYENRFHSIRRTRGNLLRGSAGIVVLASEGIEQKFGSGE